MRCHSSNQERSISTMLVPAVDVDDVVQRLPRQVAAQVIAEERYRAVHVDRRAAADVRREQDALHRPQWTLWRQGFLLEHVQRRARDPALLEGPNERRLVDDG